MPKSKTRKKCPDGKVSAANNSSSLPQGSQRQTDDNISADHHLILGISEDANDDIEIKVVSKTEASMKDKMMLEDLIALEEFVDISPIFKLLIETLDKKYNVILTFPPNTGKTVIARLFACYLDQRIEKESAISSYFDRCILKRSETAWFDSNFEKSAVLFLSFEKFVAVDQASFMVNLKKIVLKAWFEFDEDKHSVEEDNISKERYELETSLERLLQQMKKKFKKPVYVIIDSIDAVTNQLVYFKHPDQRNFCVNNFTMILRSMITDNSTQHIVGVRKTFLVVFGVSPFFAEQYFQPVLQFNIRNPGEFHNFFSFPTEKIEELIDKWCLKESDMQRCLEHSSLTYCDYTYINPYLAAKFLRARKEQTPFVVDLAPKSLWCRSLFEDTYETFFFEVLVFGTCRFDEINLNIDLKTLFENADPNIQRRLYTLFLYGGFMSCSKVQNNKFDFYMSNKVAKVAVAASLERLYEKKKRLIPFSAKKKILEHFEDRNYAKFIELYSLILSYQSPGIFSEEKDYHNVTFGLFCNAITDREVETISSDLSFALLRADILRICKDGRNIKVIEIKRIKREELDESFTTLEEYRRKTLLKKFKKEIYKAVPQVHGYSLGAMTTYRQNVDGFILVFYSSMIILCWTLYDHEKLTCEKWQAVGSFTLGSQEEINGLIEDMSTVLPEKGINSDDDVEESSNYEVEESSNDEVEESSNDEEPTRQLRQRKTKTPDKKASSSASSKKIKLKKTDKKASGSTLRTKMSTDLPESEINSDDDVEEKSKDEKPTRPLRKRKTKTSIEKASSSAPSKKKK